MRTGVRAQAQHNKTGGHTSSLAGAEEVAAGDVQRFTFSHRGEFGRIELTFMFI